MPPVCLTLILINVAAFLLVPPTGGPIFGALALWPVGQGFNLWQLLTYGFLHGGLTHLFFNMFAIYMFGRDLEDMWGARRFLTYFLVCVVTAGLVQTLVTLGSGQAYPTVGASGGMFGVLLAFAVYFPKRKLMLLIPPIPMPAWLFVTLYGLIELFLGVTNTAPGIAHFAHLGGMLGGLLMLRRWSQAR
jgi:membrane associated rhomboid family serine protease